MDFGGEVLSHQKRVAARNASRIGRSLNEGRARLVTDKRFGLAALTLALRAVPVPEGPEGEGMA
jgi:hypothetical protein